MKLHMGVQAMTYPSSHSNAATGQTTVDVARALEAKYHVMAVFVENHRSGVGKAIADMLLDRVREHRVDRGVVYVPAIQHEFDEYLETNEYYGLTGRFIGAAHHRGTAFIDTGTYQQSVRAWVTP